MANTPEIEPFPALSLQARDVEVLAQLIDIHDRQDNPSTVAHEVHAWLDVNSGSPERLELRRSGDAQYAASLLGAAAAWGRLVDTNGAVVDLPSRLRGQAQNSFARLAEDIDEAPSEFSQFDQKLATGVMHALRLVREHHGARHTRRVLGWAANFRAA